jgi:hypothetical protein
MGAFCYDHLMAALFYSRGELNHKRHGLLNVIHSQRRQSRGLQANIQDNGDLWEKMRNMNENAARQVAGGGF